MNSQIKRNIGEVPEGSWAHNSSYNYSNHSRNDICLVYPAGGGIHQTVSFWLLFFLIQLSLGGYDWSNYWLLGTERNLQPLSFPQGLENGIESSDLLIMWLVFLVTSHLFESYLKPVFPTPHTHLNHNINIHNSVTSKDFRVLYQKPETSQIYHLMLQISF